MGVDVRRFCENVFYECKDFKNMVIIDCNIFQNVAYINFYFDDINMEFCINIIWLYELYVWWVFNLYVYYGYKINLIIL